MRMSNFVRLTGNLGSAVEIKETKPGTEVARLSIAETVSRPNAETGLYEQIHTNWIPVTAFGSLAQRAARSLKKGDRVTVLGTLKTSSYEKDGENRRSYEVIADSIERSQLLGKAQPFETGPAEECPPFDEYRERTVASDQMFIK